MINYDTVLTVINHDTVLTVTNCDTVLTVCYYTFLGLISILLLD